MGKHLRLLILAAGLASGLLMLALEQPLQPLENHTADRRLVLRHRLAGLVGMTPARDSAVALVGIDEPTLRQFGKYGTGFWAVRSPFLRLLPVLRTCSPSAIAFDILFQPVGELAKDAGLDNAARMTAMLDEAARSAASGDTIPPNDLLHLTLFASNAAEHGLAAAFCDLTAPTQGAPIPVLCAFYFRWLGPDEEGAGWSQDDILGPDRANPDPARGLAIPYLLDTGIPATQIRNVPGDYAYAGNAILASPILRDSVRHAFINVPRDPDGMIRRIPLVLGFRYEAPGRGTRAVFVPSLALQTVLCHWGLKPADVEVDFGNVLILRRRDAPPLRVPIDDHGNLYLNYRARIGEFPNVSMADLMGFGERALPRRIEGDTVRSTDADTAIWQKLYARLHGRIVFVGLTATGTTDIGPSPVDPVTPYVLMHMTAADNLITNHCLRAPSPLQAGLLLLLTTFAYTLLCLGCGIRTLILATVGAAAGWLLLAVLLLSPPVAFVLPVVLPLGQVALAFGGVLFLRYLTEERGRRQVRAMFANMVSPEVLRFMEEHPEHASVSGRRAEATILFSDLAGSTAIAERLAPEALTEMLNEYFEAMTDAILATGGYLDKFEGDGIMAVWGAPYPDPDHAAAACRAALRQRDRLAELRPELHRRFGVDLSVRIGVNSGPVIAGNFGSRRKFQFTAIGDTVNQAARLEPVNKDYGTIILIGEETERRIRGRFHTRLLDRLVVMGKSHPSEVYELIAESNQTLSPVQAAFACEYESAVRLHWERRWDEAEASLNAALTSVPGDLSATRLLDRIRDYRTAPPPEDWLGELRRTRKD